MRKLWSLTALGVGAYLVFLIVTLPAGIVLARLQPHGIYASGVTGTVWRGSAAYLQVGDVPLGRVAWDLHALPLLLARLQADVDLSHPGGFGQALLVARAGGRVQLRNLTASLPVAALPRHLVRGQWNGTVNLRFEELALEDGWPVRALGRVEVMDLTSRVRELGNLGSFALTFPGRPDDAPSSTGNDAPGAGLTSMLEDLGGPLLINGTLELRSDRSWLLEAMVATRPEAPARIADMLRFLGEPDAQGRRPLRLEGTL